MSHEKWFRLVDHGMFPFSLFVKNVFVSPCEYYVVFTCIMLIEMTLITPYVYVNN
jgi:hypothetical protein